MQKNILCFLAHINRLYKNIKHFIHTKNTDTGLISRLCFENILFRLKHKLACKRYIANKKSIYCSQIKERELRQLVNAVQIHIPIQQFQYLLDLLPHELNRSYDRNVIEDTIIKLEWHVYYMRTSHVLISVNSYVKAVSQSSRHRKFPRTANER